MEFSHSLNNNYSSIIVRNLPTIIYGKNFIRKLNVPYFFKVLTGIDQELNKKDVEIKMYYEMIEKLIFSDLQMLLVRFMLKRTIIHICMIMISPAFSQRLLNTFILLYIQYSLVITTVKYREKYLKY
jgi:hypothetical protein